MRRGRHPLPRRVGALPRRGDVRRLRLRVPKERAAARRGRGRRGGCPDDRPPSGDAAKVGTLEAACGQATPARGATDKGVTDTTIKIGVISDKSGVVAVPTAGIDGSVEAFVQFCNSLGGINGRTARARALRLEDPQRGRRDEAGVRGRHLRARRLGLGARRPGRGDDGAVQAGRGRRLHRHLRQGAVAARVLSPCPIRARQYAVGPGEVHRRAVPRRGEEGGDPVAEPAGRPHAGRAPARRVTSRQPGSSSCTRTPPTCWFRTGARSSAC